MTVDLHFGALDDSVRGEPRRPALSFLEHSEVWDDVSVGLLLCDGSRPWRPHATRRSMVPATPAVPEKSPGLVAGPDAPILVASKMRHGTFGRFFSPHHCILLDECIQ